MQQPAYYYPGQPQPQQQQQPQQQAGAYSSSIASHAAYAPSSMPGFPPQPQGHPSPATTPSPSSHPHHMGTPDHHHKNNSNHGSGTSNANANLMSVPTDASPSEVYDLLCDTKAGSSEGPQLLPPGWERVEYHGSTVYVDHVSREAHEEAPWEVWRRRASERR